MWVFLGLPDPDLATQINADPDPQLWYLLVFVKVKDLMVGDDASKLRSMLEVNYPMKNGMVRSWEDMQHVWVRTFLIYLLGTGTWRVVSSPSCCRVEKTSNSVVAVSGHLTGLQLGMQFLTSSILCCSNHFTVLYVLVGCIEY